jgi:hypothetical protein
MVVAMSLFGFTPPAGWRVRGDAFGDGSWLAPEAYKKMKEVLGGGEMAKFDSKIQCDFNDQKQQCSVSGTQAKKRWICG